MGLEHQVGREADGLANDQKNAMTNVSSNRLLEDSSELNSAKPSLNSGANDQQSPVRVWWGYKRPDVSQQTFDDTLGNVFIPATAQQMAPLGLDSYLPAVLPSNKAAGVPDEVAIVFYKSGAAYDNSKATVYGREYQLLHRALFDFGEKNTSTSDFPVPLGQNPDFSKPYTLFPDRKPDWQSGTSKLFVGTPLDGESTAQFMKSMDSTLHDIQNHPRPGMDGAIARVSNGFVTYWEHFKEKANLDSTDIDALSKITKPVMRSDSAQTVTVPADGDARFSGVQVKPNSFLNLQFPRH